MKIRKIDAQPQEIKNFVLLHTVVFQRILMTRKRVLTLRKSIMNLGSKCIVIGNLQVFSMILESAEQKLTQEMVCRLCFMNAESAELTIFSQNPSAVFLEIQPTVFHL